MKDLINNAVSKKVFWRFSKNMFALTAQKTKFSIKDFKSAGNCGFGHIY